MSSLMAGLQELFKSDSQLPTLPHIVFELHAALENPNVSAGELVRLIEQDPSLSARTLRTANSAFFARGVEVGSIEAAVGRLGLNQIRSMCLVLAVVKAFGTGKDDHLDHRRFWEHSAAVGLTAERLAREIAIPRHVNGTDIYIAGLLHDVGHLILDQFFPEEFGGVATAVADELRPSWQVEEERLGMDHGEVGGLLLARWSLPAAVTEAVTHHHHPDKAAENVRDVVRLVWAAEALCSATGVELPHEGMAEVAPAEALAALGIEGADGEPILLEVGALADRARSFLS